MASLAGITALWCTTAAWASADPDAGREFAAAVCGQCHATEPGTQSRLAEAPPFLEIVVKWPPDSLVEALAEGIVVSHSEPRMPEFQLPPERIDDLISYMESLRP